MGLAAHPPSVQQPVNKTVDGLKDACRNVVGPLGGDKGRLTVDPNGLTFER